MREFTGSIAYEVQKRKYGVGTRLIEHIYDVGTEITQIAQVNPRRVTCIVCNRSSDTVIVGFSPNMTVDEGLVLSPNGGTMTLTVDEDGEVTAYDMYAMGVSTGGTVYVLEIIGG